MKLEAQPLETLTVPAEGLVVCSAPIVYNRRYKAPKDVLWPPPATSRCTTDLHACRQTPMHIKQNEKTNNGKPCKNKHIKCVYPLCIISSWLSPIQDAAPWPCSAQLLESCQIQCQCRRRPCHGLLFQFIANMIKTHYTTYMKFSKYIFKQNNKIPDGKNLNAE